MINYQKQLFQNDEVLTAEQMNHIEEGIKEQEVCINTISNPNLLDNWYFVKPVNQRGKTEYAGIGNGIDRWESDFSQLKVTIGNGYIQLSKNGSGGAWLQKLGTDLRGKKVTFSALTYEGNLYQKTVVLSETPELVQTVGDAWIGAWYENEMSNTVFKVYFNTSNENNVKYIACKLELGSVQTLAHQENGVWVLNEVPNYATELAKCQYYCVAFNLSGDYSTFAGGGYVANATTVELIASLPVTMRKFPDVTITGKIKISTPSGVLNCTTMSLSSFGSTCVNCHCTVSGATAGQPCFAYLEPDSQVIFSADL